MAIKLTAKESKQRAELVSNLEIASGKLSAAITEANAKIEEANELVAAAREAYNSVLEDARNFRDDIVSRVQDEVNERSEKWQEGDKGQAATVFVEAWENLDLDDLDEDDLSTPTITEPDPAHRNELEEMQAEPEE